MPGRTTYTQTELDHYFVHRRQVVAGRDGNPLNEVELLAQALFADMSTRF